MDDIDRQVAEDRLEYIRKWAASNSEPLACHAMRELLGIIDAQRDEIGLLRAELDRMEFGKENDE